MRAAWRLAISTVSARRSRTALLVGAVALSAALIAAVACAIASANGAVSVQLEGQIGKAEIRISGAGAGATFDEGVLETVRAQREVERALPRARQTVSVRFTTPVLTAGDDGAWTPAPASFSATGYGNGVDLEIEFESRPLTLIAGRLPEAPGEILIDSKMAERLSAGFAARSAPSLADGEVEARPMFGIDVSYLDSPAPALPERVESEAGALALNALVGVRPGDTIEAVRQFSLPVSFERIGVSDEAAMNLARMFFGQARLTVVGISQPPPLGGLPQAFVGLETARSLAGGTAPFDQIEVELVTGTDAEAFAAELTELLPDDVVVATTEKVTSGLDKNLASNQLGFILASVLAMLSAAFIIMTGLTTGVAEQQRGLAVIRCIGGTRVQLAQSQLLIGLIVGTAGAAIGVPLGVGMAWAVVTLYSEFLPTGMRVPGWMLAFAAAGSVISGLAGAAWPAWRVSRTSPLAALSNRAQPAGTLQIGRVLAVACACLAVQAVIVGVPDDKDIMFWGYASLGLPAMFVGYFLLSVPVLLAVTFLLAGPVSRVFRLPPRVLARTISATPFRHGFTAGAMMAGLALMISIWTNGGSVLRDWLGKIEFPDAFVNGLRLQPEAQDRLEALDWIEETCAITMHPVEVDAFGVSALQQYRTSFIAFEPRAFFGMTSLDFVQGNADEALRRLEEGGAIIVGREFFIAQGKGVGEMFTCRSGGEEHTFEIVGVVTSPGLELASKFFNIGEEYIDQSIHAVFGTRADMKARFGSDNTQLIQIKFDEDALVEAAREAGFEGDDAVDWWSIETIRSELFGLGILDAGSGRRIKSEITTFIGGSLVVFSAVAVVSMLVACFGVANLIIAGIEARQFEFGVLRAVGGSRGLLVRLVLAEAIIVGATASIVGTLMGMQAAWAGRRLSQLLLGLEMHFSFPTGPVALGWGLVLLFTLGAAAPAILRLNRRKTRELLASVRG